jgi:hypothetical protein
MAKGFNRTVLLYAALMMSFIFFADASINALESDKAFVLPDKESMNDSSGDNRSRPAFGDEFDLEACQQECRSKFGVDPYWGHGGGSSMWRLYAICIQDCNAKFWKEYDRRIQKLKDLKVD